MARPEARKAKKGCDLEEGMFLSPPARGSG